MRKSIFTIAIVFSLFSFVFTSCNIDDVITEVAEDTFLKGSYEVLIDGETLTEETKIAAILGKDDAGNPTNYIFVGSFTVDDVLSSGLTVGGFPRTVGEVAVIDNDKVVVALTFNDLIYLAYSGTITRTSTNKVLFNGKCLHPSTLEESTFSGYLESENIKQIK